MACSFDRRLWRYMIEPFFLICRFQNLWLDTFRQLDTNPNQPGQLQALSKNPLLQRKLWSCKVFDNHWSSELLWWNHINMWTDREEGRVPRGATGAMMMEDTRRQVTTIHVVITDSPKDLKKAVNLIVDDTPGGDGGYGAWHADWQAAFAGSDGIQATWIPLTLPIF